MITNCRSTMLFLVLMPAAYGAGIFIPPCGPIQNFSGDIAVTSHCSLGSDADNAIGNAGGVAGNNFFVNNLSPIHFYGDTDNFDRTPSWTSVTSPTWDASVITVDTFIRLDGSVKLQGPGSQLTITLTGVLSGGAQNAGLLITRSFSWTGQPTEHILNISEFGKQFKGNVATEVLTIHIIGRARYDVDGSPMFDGAVPEPSAWATAGLGLAALLALKRKM